MLNTMTGSPDLSQRASSLAPSATLALAAAAKEMAAAGRDVVNMAVGEPDFDAPARPGRPPTRPWTAVR